MHLLDYRFFYLCHCRLNATASVVATLTFSAVGTLPTTAASLGPIRTANTLFINNEVVHNAIATTSSPSEALQEVSMGFQDEFLRARAEREKNGISVFRYIQKGNIEGLTDSEQNGIGPGHGKSTSALEVAIASESLRSWEQVRIDALNRTLGNQSFNDFSSSINQQQTKAGLPKLTKPQLRHFMDVSFWRAPKKGEPDMALETGDSEYYQLPKLTPNVRTNLIHTKLNYHEQISNEAVALGLTGKHLYDKLTGDQDLFEAEAKFVSDHLDAVRFARPENKTQALLRLGSEPYIQPPATKTDTPPVTLTPLGAAPKTPPVTLTPPETPPNIPPVTLKPPGLPPLIFIPPSTRSATPPNLPPLVTPPLGLPPLESTPSTSPGLPPLTNTPTPPNTPTWNRPLVVIGPALIGLALVPLITNRSDEDDDGFPNTPSDEPRAVPEPTPVPEPSSILGIVTAGVGLVAAKFKRSEKKKS